MQVFTVSQFLNYLNETFKAIWDTHEVAIEGEISGYRVSQGQWVNFDIKDDESLVSCFMVLGKLRTPLEDGLRVRLYGYPRIYTKFGKFSFNVDRLELVGEGAIKKALAALKARLEAEGLFDLDRKRSLPRFPQRIALIASRESAAYGDFIRILNERWSGLEVDLYHAVVQGDKAPDSVMTCLAEAHKHGLYDAVVITRGGGSFEELMAFNDERLVRAIFASKIPTMIAIGHERDVSLAELAADIHASTPTDCARRLVPDKRDILFEVGQMQQGMGHRLTKRIDQAKTVIEETSRSAERWIEAFRTRVNTLLRLISSFDPEKILKRGFAMILDQQRSVVTSAQQLEKEQQVSIRLHDGELGAMIKGKQGKLI